MISHSLLKAKTDHVTIQESQKQVEDRLLSAEFGVAKVKVDSSSWQGSS